MEIEFFIALSIIFAGGWAFRKLLWIPAKAWFASHGFEVTPRKALMTALLAFALVSWILITGLSPESAAVPGVLVVVAYWYFVIRGGTPQASGGAADVLVDAVAMRALAAPFDPVLCIQKVRKSGRDEVFMGLDADRKPVHFPRQRLFTSHLEILGESGVGKSSLAGVMLSQLAAQGEAIVVFDPKADRMLPGVLARAGREHGFPVINIDLRYGQPPQVNPFFKARQDQVEELLQVALELGKTGQGAVDFYRAKDREATGFMAAAFADGETNMPELLEKAAEDERVTDNENLWRELRQIARIPAFQVHQGQAGHDLEALLSRPGVIYVTGSTTKLEVQAAQKLLLQRILQILDERRDQSRPVALFLDELKYILSPAALRAAGTIRDRNCHLIFAHQSLGDLSDCPGLDPKAVRGAVWGNCGLKVAYKMLDGDTAKELSVIAGERAVLERRLSENDNGTTIAESIGKASHMPPHVFTHLPKPAGQEASVGVLIGDGPAYFLATRWLPSGPAPEPIPALVRAEKLTAEPLEIGGDFNSGRVTPVVKAPAISRQAGGHENDAILPADFNDLLM